MALELRIAGPGLDAMRILQPGERELVLGRDADCGIPLPDPQRNVSRRHLAVWNQSDELHFRVLSVVNGVQMPFGEAPPGARGVLPVGQILKLGGYTVEVRPAEPPAPAEVDPWAVFDGEDHGAATVPPSARAPFASGQADGFSAPAQAEDDPFGDWGFESTFGPSSSSSGGGLQAVAQGPGTGDLSSFFQGLGLDAAKLGPLNPGELEAIGRAVRTAVVGLLELHAARGSIRQDMRTDDRTMMAVKDNNPLKTDWPEQTKLQYLFGGRAASVGFVSAERAMGDLLAELLAHDAAVGKAARAAVEGTVREFSPAALKSLLLGNGSKLFEGARTWDAYCRYYAEQSQGMSGWVQRLLEKYFTEAYLRESQRIQRETAAKSR
jgi:predicted component of type VI protein secretion system